MTSTPSLSSQAPGAPVVRVLRVTIDQEFRRRAQHSVFDITKVASDLQHPRVSRIGRDAGDPYRSSGQLMKNNT